MSGRLFAAGQIVICINDDFSFARKKYPEVLGYPVFGQRYQIRDYVCDGKAPAVVLQEFTNPRVPYIDGVWREAGFWDKRFVNAPPLVYVEEHETLFA
jgi:hypothetical protein